MDDDDDDRRSPTSGLGGGGGGGSAVRIKDVASAQIAKGDTVLAVKGDLKGALCTVVDVLPNPGRASDLEVLIMPNGCAPAPPSPQPTQATVWGRVGRQCSVRCARARVCASLLGLRSEPLSRQAEITGADQVQRR
jgi:hypothetical protein